MATKQKTKNVSDESRVDTMIHRLVSAWLNQQDDAPTLSANQKSQFVAWVGADAERWLSNNWRSWPGRPANSTRPIYGRK
jgi:hypothetical protein